MNKAVMVSIQPKWCELIASGKKTIEVRKTKPSIKPPFKCYITAHKNSPRLIKRHIDKGWLKDSPEQTWQILVDYGFTHPILNGDYELNGKVVGSFVCDKIDEFLVFENKSVQNWNYFDLAQSCLSYDELADYVGANHKGCGWHISDLVIYDKPKELSEFRKENGMILTRPFQSWGYVCSKE